MPAARLTLDPAFVVTSLDRRIFGSFVEHLGRCVYDGLYEPGHPTADGDGFREDVVELVRELGVSTIRYPGGNFVSGYRWEDGVGPRDQRPKRLDTAWHSLETNQVGLHEFAKWCDKVGSELMLAVNLGTRGVQEAVDLLEYTNISSPSAFSQQRVANGAEKPFDVRMWCLGNEMDGPWQLGYRSAEDYGVLASRTAKAMRQLDPDLQLVACGSSHRHMPTFGAWERTVLEHTYDDVDYISCHAYYFMKDGDLGSFLACATDMDAFIEEVATAADHVKSVTRSDKTMAITFDEWNVWYQERYRDVDRITALDEWPEAPRLLEDVYSVADAVVVGNLLISLLKHGDRVRSACLAQLVNVIAPIMTEPGGAAWKQTTFFPFALTSRLAQGEVLKPALEVPTYSTALYGDVPLVDAVATRDPETGAAAVFLVNRSTEEPVTVSIDVERLGALRIAETHTLADADPLAANTREDQERVAPAPNDTASLDDDGVLTIELPPVSWTVVALSR
ncbi:alpha-N-arabinofuranosidase [Amnibacterium sp. CER49]|uniref:arabinosylfuranosidase ArfA n=1 Tax=Amnibacterium sp. CER49 TaxID=3039161 RepID=UPI0024480CCE|nr:alpha-N-arabinofuranosidase [Amnibacterium sp. CER49]MDH2444060.1 alpha-N-arabinofuranosidase [Amnibacterium sp. CER49]